MIINITDACARAQESNFMNACLTTHALPEHPDGVALSVAVYPKLPDHVRNIEQAKEYLDRVFSSMQDCAGWEFEVQIGSEADQ